MRVRLLTPLVAALTLSAWLSSPLLAAPAKKQARSKPNPAVEQAKTLLASGEHDAIETGIQSLGLLGTPDAVPPLVERIRAGLAPDLLDTAIVTLMALGQQTAAPVLFDLIMHRRRSAVAPIEAVVAIAPGAEDVQHGARSEPQGALRALGLGEIKAVGSVDPLFRALDKGNFEASSSIGSRCAAIRSRHARLPGQKPLQSLGPALGEVLQRKDISERDKLMIVSRLQDVGTPGQELPVTHACRAKTPARWSCDRPAMQEIVD
jgi:hypothetical protein